jgi:PAS domain S-box-containing protein
MQRKYPGILTKTLLLICTLVCTLTLASILVSFNLVTEKFQQLETEEVAVELERVVRKIYHELDTLASSVADWAPWDETHTFVEQLDQAYRDRNLSETGFQTLGLNFMLFFDNDNQLVYSQFYDLERDQFTAPDTSVVFALRAQPDLFHFASTRDKKSGLLLGASTPALIAAAPITTSTYTGPVRGTLVFGRALNRAHVARIGDQTRAEVDMFPYKQTYRNLFATAKTPPFVVAAVAHPIVAQLPDKQTLRGFTLFKDLRGKPAVIFTVTKERKLFLQGLAMWRQHTFSMIALGVVFVLSLVVLLHRTILRRLTSLTGEVMRIADNGNHTCRVRVRGNDEIGELALCINGMLASLQQLQMQQQQNEQYLQEIFDSITCGIMIIDGADRRILSINRAGAALSGRPAEEMVGRICHQFVCPHELRHCPILDKGETLDLSERTLLHADGRQIPVLKSVNRISRQGKELLVESFIDISELKQAQANLAASEAKYRKFYEEDLTGDFITTPEGLLIDCNPAFARMLGYDSPAELIGSSIQKYHFMPQKRPQLLDRLREKGKLQREEGILLHLKGQPVYIISNLIGEFDDRGALTHIRGYVFDDTKRVVLEKEVRQAQKLEAIGTMAGGIAHDFNNILAGIIGYAEIVLRDLDEEQAPKICRNLRHILSAGERGRGLIDKILTFSRRTEGEQRPVNLEQVLEDALQLIRVSLPSTIAIDRHILESPTVFADPIQLHQVFMNLCTNAGHAMKEEGGTLTITLDTCHLDTDFTGRYPELTIGDYSRIQIADTGKGIPEHLLNRIFDPFFTTKKKGEGTGLGLSMVHGIVAAMHGLITVDSNAGSGTCFTIYLPQSKEEEIMTPIAHQPPPIGHEHVVYIDDQDFLVDIGTEILRGLGYRVTGFTNSREALDFVLQYPEEVDLVVSDLTMPDLTGIDLSQALQELPAPPPVIICTGHNDGLNREDVARLGIHELLLKPVTVNTLAQVVRSVLDRLPQP